MTLSPNRLTRAALLVVALIVTATLLFSGDRHVAADGDATLEQIAQYRTWHLLTKEPVKGVPVDASPAGGG